MDLPSRDYTIRDVCSLMGVSRVGYYKWKKRPPSKRDINRKKMTELVRTVHDNHRTHGYRWVAHILESTSIQILVRTMPINASDF